MRQKPLRKQLYLRLGGRRMLERAAALHYTTAEERRLAEESLGLGRGVVIPLGVGEEFLHPAAAQNGNGGSPYGKYVLQLSRLHPKKGIELLLDSFLSICAQTGLKDWRLILAGDGERPYVAALKRIVEEKRGEDRVVFAGWLEGEEKLKAVKHAALLTLPSYQENFGLCVVEALACGVPVLVSRHVNLAPEFEAAECGWVTPTEPQTLSRLLTAALSDEAERKRRGAAGRTLASRNYSWQAVREKLVSLYAGLAGS
jgi:glycosyltransferase involved in cell wall biosynthesis